MSLEEAVRVAEQVGYPALVRPSYVLGGRGMEIVYDEPSLRDYFTRAIRVAPGHPVLIDRFLEDAFEADVDAIADGQRCVIGGVMQHIEDAGIHSGDSACVLPPYLISEAQVEQMRVYTRAFAKRLEVVGLINVQYAIKDGIVYVLEVNPRASRTVPFVSKTTGVQLASLAASVMVGKRLDDLGLEDDVGQPYVAVKEAVFPFNKLHGVDLILGPEMRSTGEVMGISESFGMAFAKAQHAADGALPMEGGVFITVNDHDKAHGGPDRAAAARAGLLDLRDRWHRAPPAGPRNPGRTGAQGLRGTPQRHRPPGVGPDPASGQHAPRQTHPAGRLHDPGRGAGAPRPLHDHHVRRVGGGGCDHRVAQSPARGAIAAGVARDRPPRTRHVVTTARDPAFVARLRALVRGEVREAEPLARCSTYRIGGPATLLLPLGPEDVGIALRAAAEQGVKWFALGLGSNLLLPDAGLDALVIRLGKGIDRLEHLSGGRWGAGAGLPQPLAARRTAEAGFAGLHRFVGVPGSVGGGVYMNAGCHGGDWAGVVLSVTVVDERGEQRSLTRDEIPFTYRRSGLERRVVLDTVVQLAETDPAKIQEEVAELFRWRQEGTPFNQPCCGSVFKNPGGPSWKQADGPRTAGQLIEAAGLKGTRLGGAEVSGMHANYFVNTGGATAADILGLIALARRAVRQQFGVELETEVKIVRPDGTFEPSL